MTWSLFISVANFSLKKPLDFFFSTEERFSGNVEALMPQIKREHLFQRTEYYDNAPTRKRTKHQTREERYIQKRYNYEECFLF